MAHQVIQFVWVFLLYLVLLVLCHHDSALLHLLYHVKWLIFLKFREGKLFIFEVKGWNVVFTLVFIVLTSISYSLEFGLLKQDADDAIEEFVLFGKISYVFQIDFFFHVIFMIYVTDLRLQILNFLFQILYDCFVFFYLFWLVVCLFNGFIILDLRYIFFQQIHSFMVFIFFYFNLSLVNFFNYLGIDVDVLCLYVSVL